MTASDVLEAPDKSWQKRIAAATEPMGCLMGSFGPNAYNTRHLIDPSETGHQGLKFHKLPQKNQLVAQQGSYRTVLDFDNFTGDATALLTRLGEAERELKQLKK